MSAVAWAAPAPAPEASHHPAPPPARLDGELDDDALEHVVGGLARPWGGPAQAPPRAS